ncbi:MAG: hypothetical protein PHP02_07400 [Eubacteriales bacterium]|nr:hypothetical protein [Eubacteriales bacterium]
MIDNLKRDAVMKDLLAAEGLRFSLYIPTHRLHPDNRQDPITYKNQLKAAEAALEEAYPRREWQDIMGKLNNVLDDQELWNHTTEGLAVLAGGPHVATFLLEHTVEPKTVVGAHYHLLPLYPLLPSITQAYLADISRDRFSMYLVSREGIAQVETPEIKASFPELFDDFDTNSDLNSGSYAGMAGTYHGHRARPEEVRKDREKYFRYLDDAFAKRHRETGLPIILAGMEQNLVEYRSLAKGDFYLDGSINKPLDALDYNAILLEVKGILKPYLESALDSLRTRISNKQNENKATANLGEFKVAAREGRVETVLAPMMPEESERKGLDEAVELVLLNGGAVYTAMPDVLESLGGRVALMRY